MGIFSFPLLAPGLAFLLPLLLAVLSFPLPPDILAAVSPAQVYGLQLIRLLRSSSSAAPPRMCTTVAA